MQPPSPRSTHMYLRVSKRRLHLRPSSSEHEIFQHAKTRSAWPRHHVYFEWGNEGRQVEILNDDELRLACRILSEHLFDDQWSVDFRKRETKAQAHMDAEDSEDERVTSDEDLTIEDLYTMGFRHEFY